MLDIFFLNPQNRMGKIFEIFEGKKLKEQKSLNGTNKCCGSLITTSFPSSLSSLLWKPSPRMSVGNKHLLFHACISVTQQTFTNIVQE